MVFKANGGRCEDMIPFEVSNFEDGVGSLNGRVLISPYSVIFPNSSASHKSDLCLPQSLVLAPIVRSCFDLHRKNFSKSSLKLPLCFANCTKSAFV